MYITHCKHVLTFLCVSSFTSFLVSSKSFSNIFMSIANSSCFSLAWGWQASESWIPKPNQHNYFMWLNIAKGYRGPSTRVVHVQLYMYMYSVCCNCGLVHVYYFETLQNVLTCTCIWCMMRLWIWIICNKPLSPS